MSEQETPEVESQTDAGLEQAIDDATEAVAGATAALDELGPGGTSEPMGLGNLMSVPVKVTVEVGRTRMPLSDLVELGPGSLVELDRAAHEPADVLVNGKVVARGEIVTIGDNYGVRISEVVKG